MRWSHISIRGPSVDRIICLHRTLCPRGRLRWWLGPAGRRWLRCRLCPGPRCQLLWPRWSKWVRTAVASEGATWRSMRGIWIASVSPGYSVLPPGRRTGCGTMPGSCCSSAFGPAGSGGAFPGAAALGVAPMAVGVFRKSSQIASSCTCMRAS